MDDRVHAVGARRDPGDEDGGEEEDGALGVRPRRIVELMVAPTIRVRRARHTRRRLRPRGEAANGLRRRLGIRCRLGRVLAALNGQVHVLYGLDRLRVDVDRVCTLVSLERRPRLRADCGVATEWRGACLCGIDGLAGDSDLEGSHRVRVVAVDGHGIGVGGVKVA